MKKNYSITQHIFHHADKIIYNDGNLSKNIESEVELKSFEKNLNKDLYNFTFSFDGLNFENEKEVKEKLEKFMNDLKSIKINSSFYNKRSKRVKINNEEYYDKKLIENGYIILSKEYVKETYRGKEQNLVKYNYKKRYERIEDLLDCFIALHTKSYEEKEGNDFYKIKPHFHIVFQQSKKSFGKNFTGLNKEIEKLSSKHNLIVNVKKLETNLSLERIYEKKSLQKGLSKISWSILKNPKFILKNDFKEKGKYSINLKNIEGRINRYIELGGSLSFAKKIQYNLKNKLNKNIEIKLNIKDKLAINNIKEMNYIDAINNIAISIAENKKISEIYRDYISKNSTLVYKDYLSKFKDRENSFNEIIFKKAIKDLFMISSKKYDKELDELYIDFEEINKIKDKYINKFNKINEQEKEQFINYGIYRILNQKELRKRLQEWKIDLNKTLGKTEFKLLFENNLNYVKNNIKDLNTVETKQFIFNMDLSEKWKENIYENIMFSRKDFEFTYEKIRGILDQQELRGIVKEFDLNLKEILGKTEFELLFENNLNYVKNNTKDLNTVETKQFIFNMDLSEKWKENIYKKIVEENINKFNYNEKNSYGINYSKIELIEMYIQKSLSKNISNMFIKTHSFYDKEVIKKVINKNLENINEFINVYKNYNRIVKSYEYRKDLITERENLKNKLKENYSEEIMNKLFKVEDKIEILSKYENYNYLQYIEARFEYKKYLDSYGIDYNIAPIQNKYKDLGTRKIIEFYNSKNRETYYGEEIKKDDKIIVVGSVDKDLANYKKKEYKSLDEITINKIGKDEFEIVKMEVYQDGNLLKDKTKVYSEEEKNNFRKMVKEIIEKEKIREVKEIRKIVEFYKPGKDITYYVEEVEKNGEKYVVGSIDKNNPDLDKKRYKSLDEATRVRIAEQGFEIVKLEVYNNGKLVKEKTKIYSEQEKLKFKKIAEVMIKDINKEKDKNIER